MLHLSWALRAESGLTEIEEGGKNARKDEVTEIHKHVKIHLQEK